MNLYQNDWAIIKKRCLVTCKACQKEDIEGGSDLCRRCHSFYWQLKEDPKKAAAFAERTQRYINLLRLLNEDNKKNLKPYWYPIYIQTKTEIPITKFTNPVKNAFSL